MGEHQGHDFTLEKDDDGERGWWLCLTCGTYVVEVLICGVMTKRGTPCQAAVRDDLGYTACWTHGRGRRMPR